MTEKKPSMALIQQASVRMKGQIQRGRLLTLHDVGVSMGGAVVDDGLDALTSGTNPSMVLEKF
jgi:hypothetical protein